MTTTGGGKAAKAAQAFRLLFLHPDRSGNPTVPGDLLLNALAGALGLLPGNAAPAEFMNAACRCANDGDAKLCELIDERMFDACVAHGVLPGDLAAADPAPDAAFLLKAAAAVYDGLESLPQTAAADQLLPSTRAAFAGLSTPDNGIAARLTGGDRFARRRVFQYVDGAYMPSRVDANKGVDKFFGFPSVRAIFADHFHKFAAGGSNLPLLVNSLPGYGKTSLTVSHALAEKEITLILAPPESLCGDWKKMITPLKRRPDHRFVLFFDDIDPRSTDWYEFRTNVGGAFNLPGNIMPVIAANYEFPANILSRGRKVSFPVFDEIRCLEMVEDFLASFGMRHAPRNLVNLIAAAYTEDFGQKKFTELSPRTLTRYLASYEHDMIKRKTMLDLSFGKMITKPDAQLFYEFNIDLMRSLYGDAYIERLLKERLKDLEG
ncbi:MAG: hypothetical protein PHI35_08920 [Victivallaceae bacterium]|nr:hypothetical protein [Victivallaceae bacterium]